MFLGVLPQRSIKRSHVDTLFARQCAAVLDVLPPQLERVRGQLVESPRPKCSYIQNGVGITMRQVEQDRRGRPIHASETPQSADPQPFHTGRESDSRNLGYFLGRVPSAPRLAARRLPSAYLEEVLKAVLAGFSRALPDSDDLPIFVRVALHQFPNSIRPEAESPSDHVCLQASPG